MKMEEIINMSEVELSKEVAKSQHDLLKLKLQTGAGQSKETSKVRLLRKHVARLQTARTAKLKSTKSAN